MTTFAEFFQSEMESRGYNNRYIADKVCVSFKTLAEIRSGALEYELQSGKLSKKRYAGLSRSVTRVLLGLDQDPSVWLKTLGLDAKLIPRVKNGLMHKGVRFEGLYEQSLNEEDLKTLTSVQAVLGEVLTVEMALEIVEKLHFKKVKVHKT